MKKLSVLATLLAVRLLSAQTTASLTGTVTVSDVPAPGVVVTISSPALQGTRTTVTADGGTYHFAALPPGAYDATFTHADLITETARTTLRLSQPSRLDVTMHIPAVVDDAVITAEAPALLDSTQVSTSLPLSWIARMPVQRNQLATAQFAPGVTANAVSNGQLQISGGPGYDNLVLVNGVVVTENTRGQMRPMYVEDAIQETTVITGAIPAEYGRFSGGVVNTITRSGGNALSGSVRDNLSNPSWSAQTPAREAREDSLSHVWEATLGGFVVRDRLWFFTSGRWAKNDTARTTIAVPAFANPATSAGPALSYTEGNDQKRYEGKLTAQAAMNHTLIASFFGIDTQGTNVRFNNNIYDEASLTTRDDPESLLALHYLGLMRANTLIEAQLSRRKFADRTGSFATDLIGGTVLLDRSNNNTRFNSPTLCGECDEERRDNDDVQLRGRTFIERNRGGAHDIVGGIERFTESRYANNHQSGSDFSLFVTRVQYQNGQLYPVVTPSNQNGGGSFIRWNPILAAPEDNELRTDSAFVNDIWNFGTRWQLSAGLRFDRNHAVDADGIVVANDSKLVPRLALQFDLNGRSKSLINVSYSEYASRIADNIASSNQAAGNAAAIDFAYRGPAINDRTLNTPTADVIRMVFDYFNTTQGGTANRNANNLRANGSRTIPGYAAYFDGSLSSPYVREMTIGYGHQFMDGAYFRADLIARDWRDFYAANITQATQRTNTPLGIPVDLTLVRNSNDVHREYRAVQLQARWSPRRFDIGAHYTYATLKGNDEGENAMTGAVPNIDPQNYYPEFFDYERGSRSEGYLPGDQRHRLRAWLGYAFDISRVNVSTWLLHNYDSGLPYSIAGAINLTRYDGAPANPGYASIPNGIYFFSDRGALRTDDTHSTDIAIRTSLRTGGIEWFAKGEVLNLFNRDDIVDPSRLGTTVSTAATSTTFLPFNPATQTPIECPRGASAATCTAMGAHYQLATNFGQPLNDLAYQRPRTVRISLGARF